MPPTNPRCCVCLSFASVCRNAQPPPASQTTVSQLNDQVAAAEQQDANQMDNEVSLINENREPEKPDLSALVSSTPQVFLVRGWGGAVPLFDRAPKPITHMILFPSLPLTTPPDQ